MPKFKMPLKKELIYMGEVLVLITGNTSFHGQLLLSTVYALVTMQHWKVGCLLLVNYDRHLVRDLEYRLLPGHI